MLVLTEAVIAALWPASLDYGAKQTSQHSFNFQVTFFEHTQVPWSHSSKAQMEGYIKITQNKSSYGDN